MALTLADRVKENTNTTGTDTLSLIGAPDGFETFSSALSDTDQTYYVIVENDKYEIGIGTYSSSALERSFVLKSSNSDSKVDLGGSGAVFITYPAEKSVFRDVESQVVVGASGLVFSNATIVKDANVTELTDINSSGTPLSSHIMTFDFDDQNLLIGDGVGNAASKSVMIGDNVGNSNSTNDAVIIGVGAATEGVSLANSVFIGSQTGPTRSDVSNSPYHTVVIGYNAADEARHESSIIGYKAGINSYSIGSTALGYFAGSGVGDYATSIGYQAGANNSDDYTINIGYQAGYSAGGDDSIWVGRTAGYNSTTAVKSMGLGYAAGQSSSADNSIYIGVSAGVSNTTDDMFFVANNTPAAKGSLIKGDIANKRLAIGAADVALAETLYVGINSANDVGLTVKSAVSQVADLTQWKDSDGNSVASMANSGVITVHGVYASGGGVQFNNITPIVTSNTLYNVGGALYFDGDALASSDSPTMEQFNYASGAAVYASGQVLSLTYASGLTATNASNITTVTSTANYASGEVLSLTYASGLTATNATDIVSTTSVANYASGQSLSLAYASGQATDSATDLLYVSGAAVYASGNTANIAFGSNVEGDLLYHDGTSFARLGKGTDNHILKMDGNVPNWEAETGVADLDYVSGIAVYSSGILTGGIPNFGAIGVGTSDPIYPVDVVQHSGVIRASGMHSAISMNADDTTVIFDLDQATTHGVTLGGNRILALSNVRIGDKFLIRLQQDGSGDRTVTWFNHIKWVGGSAPTLTTTADKSDLLGFLTASGTGSDYWFDGLVVGQNI